MEEPDHGSTKILGMVIFTREKGIEIVKIRTMLVSDDLEYWPDYIGKDYEYFWNTAILLETLEFGL